MLEQHVIASSPPTRPSTKQSNGDGAPAPGRTEIVAHLHRLKQEVRHNWHSLPAANQQLHVDAEPVDQLVQLFGEQLLQCEFSYTGGEFGSPMQPHRGGVLTTSLEDTAFAFGADRSWYVTTGTTTSNYAVMHAVTTRCKRILCDGSVHQSIVNALEHAQLEGRVTYASVKNSDDGSERSAANFEEMLEKVREASLEGKPFDAVVVSASSYEGVQVDLLALLKELLRIQDNILFAVDEAWNGIRAFCPIERPTTAIGAARAIAKELPSKRFEVVATQSAHKSMRALRQASFIHAVGSEGLIEALEEGRQRYETTSPSFPIYASLEIARKHAFEEGALELAKARHRADRLRSAIETIDGYSILPTIDLESRFVSIDPLRISIDFSQISDDGPALKRHLAHDHGCYVNRVTNRSLLVNVTIGSTDAGLERLVEGLKTFAFIGRELTNNLIPYPPGRVIAKRGDKITADLMAEITRLLISGADIHTHGTLEKALLNVCRP